MTSFTLPFDVALIALGILAALWHPPAHWVENSFTNGYYPGWEHFWASFTPAIPFSLGDAVVLAGVAVLLAAIAFARPLWRLLIGIGAIAGLYALWFYAGWGFGYDRAPLETRVAYDAARVNAAAIERLRSRAITELNRLAPAAHAEIRSGPEGGRALAMLRASWYPVLGRLGDRWQPHVSGAKPTLAGWFMDKSGTSGFTNPFTLETQLAPDLLWFERPFSQAHEWSHVAGFNREDEANYVAVLACLRDPDPAAQYSGWIELFTYLPPLTKYPRSMFVSQVWADFAALRERNKHFVNLSLSRFSWRVYNNYLKSNHVASGVQNYDEVTRLMAGIPLDAQGLPVADASGKSASTPRGNM